MNDDSILNFVAIIDGEIKWSQVDRNAFEDQRSDYDLLRAVSGRYVRAQKKNNRDTWQVCAGGSSMGSTLTWHGTTDEEMARSLARGLGAKFYKTKAGFERAIERALA